MYKITIEKIDTVTVTSDAKWGVIEKRPYTKEEVESVYSPESIKAEIKEVLGYLPEVKEVKKVNSKILEQMVEDIDLNKVIIAVNGIEP